MKPRWTEDGWRNILNAQERGREKRRERLKREYDENPSICISCGSILPQGKRANKFCGHSCAAFFNNRARGYKIFPKIEECKNCGKKIEGLKHYCDHICHSEYRRKKYISQWLSDDVTGGTGKYGDELSTIIRKYLFEKNGDKCSKCCWGEKNVYTGRIPLEVNHVDGDSSNHRPENLELLCPNCHSLTKNAKNANRGNGRRSRRERRENDRKNNKVVC